MMLFTSNPLPTPGEEMVAMGVILCRHPPFGRFARDLRNFCANGRARRFGRRGG
jgi:hypothetical protein